MNHELIKQKIETLHGFNKINIKIADSIISIILKLSDWELFRINPLQFAKKNKIEEKECIDFFIHSAKIGLFNFNYNMICPVCGGIVKTHESIDKIEKDNFHCYTCNIDVPVTLDEQVEVSFTIHPRISNIQLNFMHNLETYYQYHFSSNFQKSKELLTFLSSKVIKGFTSIKPDESKNIRLKLIQNRVVQLTSIENNSSVRITVEPHAPKLSSIEINMTPDGFKPKEIYTSSKEYVIHLTNHTKSDAGFMISFPNIEKIKELLQLHPNIIYPFLTAKMLLNNQGFRELFRIQSFSENLNLNIKSLTILFTDLKGSTSMYDKLGDIEAYDLVQKHFLILHDVINQFSGAIIKTMGDAIMASFSNPLEGFLAAIEMMNRIDQFNDNSNFKNLLLGLKIGLNEGPALAVSNDGRLDYFGQSVNIASRIQNLAKAGEIFISESILQSPEIKKNVEINHLRLEKQIASLKGIESSTTVYRVFK